MKSLKTEEVNGTTYRDIYYVYASMNELIENVYNRDRLQPALRHL